MITWYFARSLKNAYRRWQSLNGKLQALNQGFILEIEKAKIAAQRAGVDAPDQEGILSEAHNIANPPMPKKLLDTYSAISNGFAILGTSFWRSTPPSLLEALDHFESQVKQRSHVFNLMRERLYTVCTVLDNLSRRPEYASDL
ncbi:MAG: hypothetical protein JRI50_11840, partial [Deltaproteobacteria bacterium]|nr:hypothetical protein [Deltaproteobacteria bacterium]